MKLIIKSAIFISYCTLIIVAIGSLFLEKAWTGMPTNKEMDDLSRDPKLLLNKKSADILRFKRIQLSVEPFLIYFFNIINCIACARLSMYSSRFYLCECESLPVMAGWIIQILMSCGMWRKRRLIVRGWRLCNGKHGLKDSGIYYGQAFSKRLQMQIHHRSV